MRLNKNSWHGVERAKIRTKDRLKYATALAATAAALVGLSACTEMGHQEHDGVTRSKLEKIIKPKLNQLGELAVCLSKHDKDIDFYDSDDQTVVFDAYRKVESYEELSQEFYIHMGTKLDTHQPDPQRTLSARVSSSELPRESNGNDNYDILEISAPGQPGNPTDESYYAENFSSIGALDDPLFLFSTDPNNPGSYTANSKGEPTAVASAQSITDANSMEMAADTMRDAVENSGTC